MAIVRLLGAFALLGVIVLPPAVAAASNGVEPAQVAFTLRADLSGWRDDLGARNPSLLASPGEDVTVTIEYVNSLHNWAIYPGGTLPGQVSPGDPGALVRSADVWSGDPVASVVFAFPAGLYEYFCEYHPFSMHGQFVVGNAAPTVGDVTVAPVRVVTDEPATFSVSALDPNGDPLDYTWDFGDGATATGNTSSGGGPVSASHTYRTAGTYGVTVTVADPDGLEATASVSVIVMERSPWTDAWPVLATLAGLGVGGLVLVAWFVRRRRKGDPATGSPSREDGPRDDSK